MRLLIVNPNTTRSMTVAIGEAARRCAAPDTTVVAIEPLWGPESIESQFEGYVSAAAVLDRLATWPEEFDALVMAGFGEPGREAAQELLSVPVFDITECAAHLACLLGRTFSVVTTVQRAVPQITDRLLLAGLSSRCASVRATGLGVLALEENDAKTCAAIIEQGRQAIEVDGAEVLCLGCGGMAGLDAVVSAALGVPVIDGVAAAVKLAEAAFQLRLQTSKVATYAPLRSDKHIRQWPVSRYLPASENDNRDASS